VRKQRYAVVSLNIGCSSSWNHGKEQPQTLDADALWRRLLRQHKAATRLGMEMELLQNL
jgi:hypothetical protein